ncbi:hypothetical protein, partial [uncultured Campylobacter sp.]|uniref:hypothetical protein n=1 Tax=uncultured Campylobacter sp. TaxID=218934 RepID=UPI00261F7E3F
LIVFFKRINIGFKIFYATAQLILKHPIFMRSELKFTVIFATKNKYMNPPSSQAELCAFIAVTLFPNIAIAK